MVRTILLDPSDKRSRSRRGEMHVGLVLPPETTRQENTPRCCSLLTTAHAKSGRRKIATCPAKNPRFAAFRRQILRRATVLDGEARQIPVLFKLLRIRPSMEGI